MVESSINDAKMNVKENKLEGKCNFVLGKAEDKVNDICQAATEVKVAKIKKINVRNMSVLEMIYYCRLPSTITIGCVLADPKIS